MHSLRQYNHTTPLCSFNSLRLENIFHEKVNSLKDQLAVEDCVLGTSLTYSQLNQYSNNIALKIYKTLFNAQKTQFVLLFVDSGLYVPVGYLGILTAGHAIVPITSDTPVDRLRYVLKNAEIALVITQNKYSNIFNRGVSQGIFPKLHLICIEKYMNDELDDASAQKKLSKLCKSELDPAVCIYTSGSTGAPKAVVVPHYAMTVGIMGPVSKYAINAKRRLSIVSCATDAAFDDYFGAFAVGATACIMQFSEFLIDPVKFLTHHNIDTFFASPTWLAAIPHDSLAKESHSIRTILFGSEQISISLLEKWTKAFPDVYFYNLYGPSECGIQVSMKEYHNTSNIDKITIGKPFPGNAFYIVDPKRKGDDVQLLEKDKIGELCIGGIQVGYGYLGNVEAINEHFVPDNFLWHLDSMDESFCAIPSRMLFRTGDLVRWTSIGELEYIERVQGSFIKVAGFRVEISGIQIVLERIPGFMTAIVKVQTDDSGSEILVAFLKLKIDMDKRDVEREAKRRLPPHEVPKKYFQIDELPLKCNGSVDLEMLDLMFLNRKKPTTVFIKSAKHVRSESIVFFPDEMMSTDLKVIAKVILKNVAIIMNAPEFACLPIDVNLINECKLNLENADRLCRILKKHYPNIEIDKNSIMNFANTPLKIASKLNAIDYVNDYKEPKNSLASILEWADYEEKATDLKISNDNQTVDIKSYELSDQSSLFYGIPYYNYIPAWFINIFRESMIHQLRCYFPFSLQKKSEKMNSCESGHTHMEIIDPARLKIAVRNLLKSHPVLSSKLNLNEKQLKYSTHAIISQNPQVPILPLKKISLTNLYDVRDELNKQDLKIHMKSNICIAYSETSTNIMLSVHRALSDSLSIDMFSQHLQLYYENPDREDIPIYQPIDKIILEKTILNFFPTMDKYSPITCFNFPKVTPNIMNGFSSIYYAKHDRAIVTVISGNSKDALTETVPLLISAIVHTCAYLTHVYNEKNSQRVYPFVAGYNELRVAQIPGHSGLSIHQICNVVLLNSKEPKSITRKMFIDSYNERIPHTLPSKERMINGVCAHSLDINIQKDISTRSESFLLGDCFRYTNTKSWYTPVASGPVVADLLVSTNMPGIMCSFQISHTIPKSIRDGLMPLLMQELATLELMAFNIAHRRN